MPIITTIQCDVCKKRLEILDNAETPGAEEILSVTDAASKKFFFCHVVCLRKWLDKYKCPYKTSTPQENSIDELLPGLN